MFQLESSLPSQSKLGSIFSFLYPYKPLDTSPYYIINQVFSDDAELFALGQGLCVGFLHFRFAEVVQKLETSGFQVRQIPIGKKFSVFIRRVSQRKSSLGGFMSCPFKIAEAPKMINYSLSLLKIIHTSRNCLQFTRLYLGCVRFHSFYLECELKDVGSLMC